ncbi:MAG: hypothetical protein II726_02970, partial [Elusimicrobiaceae bacterium]|nr:hypothetical protein [Elusimicrobiaceae bacterium]
MKNLLKNRKFISIISVVLAVLIGGAVWYATTREKSVNLDRNAGLNPQNNTINLEVAPLKTRNISIDGNTKTVLGDIPNLYIYDKRNKNSYDTKDFINFEYQDKDVTEMVKISPEIRGSWASIGGRELVFTPEKDWLP